MKFKFKLILVASVLSFGLISSENFIFKNSSIVTFAAKVDEASFDANISDFNKDFDKILNNWKNDFAGDPNLSETRMASQYITYFPNRYFGEPEKGDLAIATAQKACYDSAVAKLSELGFEGDASKNESLISEKLEKAGIKGNDNNVKALAQNIAYFFDTPKNAVDYYYNRAQGEVKGNDVTTTDVEVKGNGATTDVEVKENGATTSVELEGNDVTTNVELKENGVTTNVEVEENDETSGGGSESSGEESETGESNKIVVDHASGVFENIPKPRNKRPGSFRNKHLFENFESYGKEEQFSDLERKLLEDDYRKNPEEEEDVFKNLDKEVSDDREISRENSVAFLYQQVSDEVAEFLRILFVDVIGNRKVFYGQNIPSVLTKLLSNLRSVKNSFSKFKSSSSLIWDYPYKVLKSFSKVLRRNALIAKNNARKAEYAEDAVRYRIKYEKLSYLRRFIINKVLPIFDKENEKSKLSNLKDYFAAAKGAFKGITKEFDHDVAYNNAVAVFEGLQKDLRSVCTEFANDIRKLISDSEKKLKEEKLKEEKLKKARNSKKSRSKDKSVKKTKKIVKE